MQTQAHGAQTEAADLLEGEGHGGLIAAACIVGVEWDDDDLLDVREGGQGLQGFARTWMAIAHPYRYGLTA